MLCMSPAQENPRRPLVRPTVAMRRWWLKRFTREEIRELAAWIWPEDLQQLESAELVVQQRGQHHDVVDLAA